MLPPDEGLDFELLQTGLDQRKVLHSLGASFGLRDGDLDICTSCDGDSDDGVTFSFHTCLVCELVLGGVGSSFTDSSGSSSSSHPFFGS
jgi:hypothetical protein